MIDLILSRRAEHFGVLPRQRSGDSGQFIRAETGFNDWNSRRGGARLGCPQRLSSTAHLGPAQEFIQITRGFRLAEIEALNFSAVHITKLS